MVAKSPETPSTPNFAAAANTTSQSTKIPRASDIFAGHEPGSALPASDGENEKAQKIAATPSSASLVKAPAQAAVVSSQTHFVPEALHSAALAANAVAGEIAAGSSRQDQADAAGQAASSSSQQQLAELSTAAAPGDDVLPKIATPALVPNQTGSPQARSSAQPRTKDGSETAQRLDTITDASSAAEQGTGTPANAISASGPSVTPGKRSGLSSDGSAKDTASHGYASGGPASTPAEAPRSFEVSSAIALGVSGASSATPAQQILDGVQRAIQSADNSQTSPATLQPTPDGQQQPLKTITVQLSPASLGNVAVELSLKSGQLGVKLQVQEAGTVQLLRQDGSLAKLLESAGYTVQSLSIHLSPQPNQAAQGQMTPNGQSFSNQFSSTGGGQGQANSQSNKGQPTDRNGDQRPGYGRTEDVSGGGSLYV